ncbi:hypothetical protein [Clostridium tertium]|uniref:Uncharacterized protein n=1 Tax=Clostridium tertium TaxID=1559 RepID=A0A6N3E7B7_9CLOT
MRKMKFTPPTNYYNEEIKEIDEKICELINKRKIVSENKPGFPKLEYISKWAEKYNIYNDLLTSLFGSLYYEDKFKSLIEPEEFRKNISILKSVEKDNKILSVTSMQQYNNASAINVSIEWDYNGEDELINMNFDLHISEKYSCRMDSGSGANGHRYHRFIVIPALSDDVTGIELTFKEMNLETKEENDIILKL